MRQPPFASHSSASFKFGNNLVVNVFLNIVYLAAKKLDVPLRSWILGSKGLKETKEITEAISLCFRQKCTSVFILEFFATVKAIWVSHFLFPLPTLPQLQTSSPRTVSLYLFWLASVEMENSWSAPPPNPGTHSLRQWFRQLLAHSLYLLILN